MKAKAFTLVELLVVLVIIGILIALSTWGISAAQNSTKDTARQNTVKQLSLAIENYYNQARTIPFCSGGSQCRIDDLLNSTIYKNAFLVYQLNIDPSDYDLYMYYGGTTNVLHNDSTYEITVKLHSGVPGCNNLYAMGGISNLPFKQEAQSQLADKCWGN